MRSRVPTVVIFLSYFSLGHSLFQKRTVDDMVVSCDDVEDCVEYGKNYVCANNMCTCQADCVLALPQIMLTKIGEACDDSTLCAVDNSVCTERKCNCGQRMVPSEDKRSCLNVSQGIGSDCEEDLQCSTAIYGSTCLNSTCSCPTGTHNYKNGCFASIGLGSRCRRNEECYVTKNTLCINDICMCTSRYVAHNNATCLKRATGLSAYCVENVQCVSTLGSGSACSSSHICVCTEPFHYSGDGNRCVIDKGLGDRCKNDTDCIQPGSPVSLLECVINNCECKAPYYEVDGQCTISSSDRIIASIIGNVFLLTVPFLLT